MLRVVLVVTPLAEGTQVGRVAVLWCVVEVGHGQHHPNHLLRLLIEEPCMLLAPAELAMIPSTFKDANSYLLPIGRIAFLVLWSYRHINCL